MFASALSPGILNSCAGKPFSFLMSSCFKHAVNICLTVICFACMVHTGRFSSAFKKLWVSFVGLFCTFKTIKIFLFGLLEGHLKVVIFILISFWFCFFHILSHSNIQTFFICFLMSVYVFLCIFTWFICSIFLNVGKPWYILY